MRTQYSSQDLEGQIDVTHSLRLLVVYPKNDVNCYAQKRTRLTTHKSSDVMHHQNLPMLL